MTTATDARASGRGAERRVHVPGGSHARDRRPVTCDFIAVSSYGARHDIFGRSAAHQGPRYGAGRPRRHPCGRHRRYRPDAVVSSGDPERQGTTIAEEQCALLSKPSRRTVTSGWNTSASPSTIVSSSATGSDFDERHRNLPFIGTARRSGCVIHSTVRQRRGQGFLMDEHGVDAPKSHRDHRSMRSLR